MEKLLKGSAEWDAECEHFQGLVARWRTDSSNQDIQKQMGVSLKKLGMYPELSDAEPR